ncbi:MAG TPA: hydroxymethylpyrimidine/phosphomethylpyrimidine kinase [Acidiferrobacteraceae bacterium]|nr:hydroxymethylpyrimidine/phosphomethylpyrimidine kinase [Acidiferrobacteraceae bacterium]
MLRPIVLVFSGLDPTGGAGIAADIETLAALGARAAPIVSALTVQDTRGASEVVPVTAALVLAQAEAVLADLPVAAIKVGLLPTVALVDAVATLAARHPALPLVVDPVLASGRGDDLRLEPTATALRQQLLPHTWLLTPNVREAEQISGARGSEAIAQALLALGTHAVLVTGGDEPEAQVHNWLYRQGVAPVRYSWTRLPQRYHGSGCTLAAACAALLARGVVLEEAVRQAQAFTWAALADADCRGRGQCLPDRFVDASE